MTPAFPWDDWALAQGTVDARNEERRADRREVSIGSAVPPASSLLPSQPPAERLCPNCLVDLDEDGYCSMCSYLATVKRPA